jgi:molybdate transport system substrate-binding protein
MATQSALTALSQSYALLTGTEINVLSIGGIDATRKIVAGEVFDLVFLAADAIEKLMATGHVVLGSRLDWVRSPVAIAVGESAKKIDISSEQSIKAAVQNCASLSYSTGASGVYLSSLFERWGLSELVQSKLLLAAPGVPVGSLIASGQAELGFQQLTELMAVPNIQILGRLPEPISCITTFSSGLVTAGSPAQADAARAFQAYLASSQAEAIKQKVGMYWL